MRSPMDIEEEIKRVHARFKYLMDTFLQMPLLTPRVMEERWVPDMDVFETDEAIYVIIDAAGLKKEDIDITLEGDILKISGRREDRFPVSQRRYHQVELHYGPFSRSYRLPCPVEAEKVSATYKNGILEIKLPKRKPVIKMIKSEEE